MANDTDRFPSSPRANAHRAALEALFAPKVATPPPPPAKRDSAKMITVPARDPDARDDERAALLTRVHRASGRSEASRAIEAMRDAGFELPEDHDSQVQALEHHDEERVRDAMLVIDRLLASELPKRRSVLESRLRRIEDCADEAATRDLAGSVRRKLARVRAS